MTDHEKNGHIGDDVYGIDWMCPPLASLQNMQMQIKETLKPYLLAYVNKAEALATKIASDQISKEQQIAQEKVSQSQAAVEKYGYQIQEIAAEIDAEGKRLDLLEGKRNLSDIRFDYEQDIVSHEKSLTGLYQNDLKL